MSTARAITAALGGRWHGSYGMCRCVVHEDHTPSLSLQDGEKTLLVRCFATCDPLDILAEFRRRGLLEDPTDRTPGGTAPRRVTPKPLPQTNDRQGIDRALQLFDEACEPRGGPVEAYLRARRLGGLPPDCTDIRFHQRCPRSTERLPAMMCLMRDAITNEPTGVHRTYLRADGSGKADVNPAKMMLGRSAGAVVKLTPDDAVTLGLGLSEGIEDGIAIINSGWRPIWACMSTTGMSAFPVLDGIEALTLFSDADAPGQKAAAACAARWRTAAGKSTVIIAPRSVKDFAALAAAATDAA